MIVSEYFKGDNNETLKWIQHDVYFNLVGYLFEYPKSKYLNAAELIDIEIPLVEKVRSVTSFDHRIFQNHHDIIAAWYRYEEDDRGQASLFPEGGSQKNHFLLGWTRFYRSTVQDLTEYNDFVRSVLTAVCYQNTSLGYLAEEKLLEIINSHCQTGDWLNEDMLKAFTFHEAEIKMISKEDVQAIIENHLLKKNLEKPPPEIYEISKILPKGITAYNIPESDCWYVICQANKDTTEFILDAPVRLICVSTKTAHVIFDSLTT